MKKVFTFNKAWLGAGLAGLVTKAITGAVFTGFPALGMLLTAANVGPETFENIVASGVTAFLVWAIPNTQG